MWDAPNTHLHSSVNPSQSLPWVNPIGGVSGYKPEKLQSLDLRKSSPNDQGFRSKPFPHAQNIKEHQRNEDFLPIAQSSELVKEIDGSGALAPEVY